jgi:hypothetical protein
MKTTTVILTSMLLGSAAHAAPRPLTPIMGWSSWNHFQIDINEVVIRGQADAMVASGMHKAGYNYVNIDDGYFGGRDKDGKLFCNADKFPNGMKALADYIRAKGLKPGIYSEAGTDTCGSEWSKDPLGFGVGLYQHEQQDLTLMLKDWGYDFIKVDWCGGLRQKLSVEKQYTLISGIIRQLRPDVVFNVCRWEYPGDWVITTADSWRVSGDITATFDSVMHIVDQCEPLWKHCGPGHFNDMDMLQVGRGMTGDEDKAHFTMWCMMDSPLLAGNDLRDMTPATIEILTQPEIIALNQDPLCYQARRLRDDGDSELWAKPLGKTDSGEIAVTLLNRSKQPATITFNLAEIGLDPAKGYALRDVWQGKTLAATDTAATQSMQVAAHGVVVLKIKGSPATKSPF